MEFPLCEQTVTVYRLEDGQVQRTVVDNCFYRWEDVAEDSFSRRFLLVVPGAFSVKLGDRVLPGEGPETVDWVKFVPAAVEGLGQVGYVKRYPTHVQAGYRKNL